MWDRWSRHARERPEGEAIIHWQAGEPSFRWTWRQLLDAACRAAQELVARDVKRGDVCALIIRHHPSFYPVYLGVSAIGAIPAVLAYPNARLHPDKFVHGLEGMACRSGLDWLLTERALEPVLRPLVTGAASSIHGLLFPLEERWISRHEAAAHPTGLRFGQGPPSQPCLLQHSSGTTGLQKAVVLSHQAVLEHAQSYAAAICLDRDDKIASWLPLYHDMGLIAAFHLPLAFGVPTVQIDPFEWVVAPELLLQAISEERATLTWLPNFAYNFLADRARAGELESVRLDSVRMFINCGEPVRAESQLRFFERFEAHGVSRRALAACYATAETTFAVSQTRPGEEARHLAVDRDALARGRVIAADGGAVPRVCVSSGVPISGCRVKVVDHHGRELRERRVGELAIQSRSMFDGYRNDPAHTRKVLRGGWYYSGDLGFCEGGEYYVIGRKKDIIIVAGRNIYPEDVEDAVQQVPGIVPGRVIAFGLDDPAMGTEKICVVAESDIANAGERGALAVAIKRAGAAVDVTVSDVFLVPRRWLIKSSSGKPSRHTNKLRVLAGDLTPV